jgi:AcrR family transcriptional regulator
VNDPCILGCPVCERLRAAALEIIGDHGIAALSVGRLAERCGLNVNEIRAHYPTATSCLYATYDEVARAVYEDFAEAFRSEPGWRRALALCGRVLLARMARRPAEARLCFVEVLRGDHELLRRRVAARRRMVQLFVREFERRREDAGALAPMQLELLIGASFQMISSAVADGRIEELPELEEELISRANVFQPVPV